MRWCRYAPWSRRNLERASVIGWRHRRCRRRLWWAWPCTVQSDVRLPRSWPDDIHPMQRHTARTSCYDSSCHSVNRHEPLPTVLSMDWQRTSGRSQNIPTAAMPEYYTDTSDPWHVGPTILCRSVQDISVISVIISADTAEVSWVRIVFDPTYLETTIFCPNLVLVSLFYHIHCQQWILHVMMSFKQLHAHRDVLMMSASRRNRHYPLVRTFTNIFASCSWVVKQIVDLHSVPQPWLSAIYVYLLNIWEFVYFVWGLSPPKRRIVQWRNFARTRVPTMCRKSAGFYVYRGRRYENYDIFPKMRARRHTTAGWLAGCSSAGPVHYY